MRQPVGWALALLIAFCASARGDQRYPNELYVWQRLWTPDVRAAVAESAHVVAGWRVLVAEANGQGHLQAFDVDWRALGTTGRPVTAVIRIDGTLSLDTQDFVRQIQGLAARWPRRIVGALEIDHDCGTAHLAQYATFLAALRRAHGLPRRLSITALPAWLNVPAMSDVIASTDELVLQVHAVRAPRFGLFDMPAAREWIDRLDREDAKSFRVALPDYGARVVSDSSGRTLAVESEMPRLIGGAVETELTAEPGDVVQLVQGLNRRPPMHLRGLVWFRLPASGDVRIWSLPTLEAVMSGQVPAGSIVAVSAPGITAGALDVFLVNDSEADLPLPRQVELPPNCHLADGINGYELDSGDKRIALERIQAGLLHAHHRQVVGWMRCIGGASQIHVEP